MTAILALKDPYMSVNLMLTILLFRMTVSLGMQLTLSVLLSATTCLLTLKFGSECVQDLAVSMMVWFPQILLFILIELGLMSPLALAIQATPWSPIKFRSFPHRWSIMELPHPPIVGTLTFRNAVRILKVESLCAELVILVVRSSVPAGTYLWRKYAFLSPLLLTRVIPPFSREVCSV